MDPLTAMQQSSLASARPPSFTGAAPVPTYLGSSVTSQSPLDPLRAVARSPVADNPLAAMTQPAAVTAPAPAPTPSRVTISPAPVAAPLAAYYGITTTAATATPAPTPVQPPRPAPAPAPAAAPSFFAPQNVSAAPTARAVSIAPAYPSQSAAPPVSAAAAYAQALAAQTAPMTSPSPLQVTPSLTVSQQYSQAPLSPSAPSPSPPPPPSPPQPVVVELTDQQRVDNEINRFFNGNPPPTRLIRHSQLPPPTRDEFGLIALVKHSRFREVVKLAEQLLADDGITDATITPPHMQYVYRFYHISALMRLRRYDNAQHEIDRLEPFFAADKSYEQYPEHYCCDRTTWDNDTIRFIYITL